MPNTKHYTARLDRFFHPLPMKDAAGSNSSYFTSFQHADFFQIAESNFPLPRILAICHKPSLNKLFYFLTFVFIYPQCTIYIVNLRLPCGGILAIPKYVSVTGEGIPF